MRRNNKQKNTKVELIVYLVAIGVALIKTIINIACTNIGEATSLSASEAVAVLSEAEEVTINTNYRTFWKKDYSVIVDGKCIATVEGEVFKPFGDTFTMYSTNGEVITKEKEEVFHFNRQAQFYDANGEKAGRLESKYFTILNKDSFYNKDDEKIARCDQKFVLFAPAEYTIHNLQDSTLYELDKVWFFNNYELSVEDNSVLDIIDAILISCIEDVV